MAKNKQFDAWMKDTGSKETRPRAVQANAAQGKSKPKGTKGTKMEPKAVKGEAKQGTGMPMKQKEMGMPAAMPMGMKNAKRKKGY